MPRIKGLAAKTCKLRVLFNRCDPVKAATKARQIKQREKLMAKLTVERLRGSLLRCLLLTSQSPHRVAETLTSLTHIPNVTVSPQDYWMPKGLSNYKETTLLDNDHFLSSDRRRELKYWWLKKPRGAMLPNWDIAATCTIERGKGLLLIEAKAHDRELSEAGKPKPTTPNGRLNHEHIKMAIDEANTGLNQVVPGWRLARDSHYQLSNRFAWVWKLTALEVPVVLIYLGFLDATEMLDQGQYFDSDEAWQACIRNHSNGIVPEDAWERRLEINGTPVWFLIRSARLTLDVMG